MAEPSGEATRAVSYRDVGKSETEGPINFNQSQPVHQAPSLSDASEESLNDDNEEELERVQTQNSRAGKTVVSFKGLDPDNPIHWSARKKYYVVFVGIISVMNSTIGSSLPSGAMPKIAKVFHITNEQKIVLPVSLYLVGYVVGPLLFGPLSEHYGRKIIFVAAFVGYTVFTMATALSPTYNSLIVFRWLCGTCASAPIAMVGGLYADIYHEPRIRGRTMAYFMAATTFGPLLGPIASGFISSAGWRWAFWLGLILAGVSLPFICLLPETYAPVLLQRRAAKLRKETGDLSIVAPYDLEKKGPREMMTVVLTRPIRMIIQESIVLFTCMYLSLAYAIYYLYFQAYPLIFGPKGIYGMSQGVSGLAFLPIGIGATFSLPVFLWYDNFLARAQKRHAPWAEIEEYRRLPLACLGGPLYVISLFWLGWSSYGNVHWIVPMLSGVTFGMGFMLIFMAMLNYLTDAYQTFAASAQGAASTCRSLGGALLPLAATSMYTKLGVHWASSLLAFASLAMAAIPFAFIKYGNSIRANSRFCQHLLAMEEKEAEREQRAQRQEARETVPDVSVEPEKGVLKETA